MGESVDGALLQDMISYCDMLEERLIVIDKRILSLIEEYRDRCLWFLRSDYVPTTNDEIIQVLTYIERYGDRNAYIRSEEIKRWLSRHSKERS